MVLNLGDEVIWCSTRLDDRSIRVYQDVVTRVTHYAKGIKISFKRHKDVYIDGDGRKISIYDIADVETTSHLIDSYTIYIGNFSRYLNRLRERYPDIEITVQD